MNENQEFLMDNIIFLYRIIDMPVNNTIISLVSKITDEVSAIKATKEYDVDYFCKLLYSVEAKTKIAKQLSDTCSQFSIQSSIWDMIVSGNPVILSKIDILQNKSKIIEKY
jgi:hypothetical protein